MKNGFLKGFISGLVVMLIVVGIFAGIFTIYRITSKYIGLTTTEYGSIDSKIEEIKEQLEANYFEEVDPEKLKEEAFKGYVDGLGDPYTVYFTKDEFDSFKEETDGSYEGIGAYIGYGDTKEELIIISPMKGSPAEQAGLEALDRILKVDGEEVSGMTIEALVKLIKGPKNTTVTLTLLRDGEEFDVDVKRQKIIIPTIEAKTLDGNIGYIKISGFEGRTYDQFKKEYDKLIDEDINGLIIDLRYNPGGLTHIVSSIADELLPKDLTIYYTADKDGNEEYIKTVEDRFFDKPLVLLINEGSASASEILSGAIKDHERGLLVGAKTFGKGLVQQAFYLDDGSAVKITIARYFTPNGNYIHGTGIEPDVEVEQPELEEGQKLEDNDVQLDRAIEEINKMIDE